jgi:uncharacterized protein (TIGR03437 family)
MSCTFQRSLLAVLVLLSPLTAAAVNVITGSITLSNTVSSEEVANLDLGTRGSPGDLAFITPGVLVPQGNATAADNVGTGEGVYDNLTPETLQGPDYSPGPFTIYVNDVLGVKTNGGHLAKLLVTDLTSSSVTFKFTTYGAQPGPEVLQAFPPQISLNYQVGTTPLPTQTFTVNGTAGPERFNLYALTYSGTNFFGLNGSSGVTPWTEHTSLLSNLFVRSYTGAIYGQSQDQPYGSFTIPVTANVTSAPTVYVNPSSLTFLVQAGSTAAPPDQYFGLTVTGPAVPFIFSASNSALTFDPPSGTPPLNVSVGINPQAFTGVKASNIPFDYSLTGTSANALTFSLGVNVFVVGPKTPIITSVVNAGSFFPGPVSGNQLVSVFGQNLALTTQGLQFTSAGILPTTVDGTSVSLNAGSNGSFDAFLTYLSPTQINAVLQVPQINGAATATLQVFNNGEMSNSFLLSLVNYNCTNDRAKEECPPAPAPNPALFTLNGAGNGPAAALNQDGTPNGPNNPAAPGSIIQLFGTGFGPTSPPQTAGSVTSTTAPFPTLVTSPTVTIGGQPAPIVYAGAAPGLVAGVVQVNVSIPNLKPGPYLAAVTVGTTPNPQPQPVLVFTGGIAPQ